MSPSFNLGVLMRALHGQELPKEAANARAAVIFVIPTRRSAGFRLDRDLRRQTRRARTSPSASRQPPTENETSSTGRYGHQLFGSYTALESFRNIYRTRSGQAAYAGWEVHHVVEDQDLDRLGVAQHFPVYKQQLCVILPRAAHVNRINNILRNRNPTRYSATANESGITVAEAKRLYGRSCLGLLTPPFASRTRARANSDQAASCPQMTNVRAGRAPSGIPSIQCVRISL